MPSRRRFPAGSQKESDLSVRSVDDRPHDRSSRSLCWVCRAGSRSRPWYQNYHWFPSLEVVPDETGEDRPPSESCLEVGECWLVLESEPVAANLLPQPLVLCVTGCSSSLAASSGHRCRYWYAPFRSFRCVRL